MDACQPANVKGVTELVQRSARAVGSAMLVRSTSRTAMMRAMVLAGTTFVELEICTEGLALVVDQVAKLAVGAEGRFSITKCLLMALAHVQMGPAEADNAEALQVVSGTGAKGMIEG